MSRVQPEKGGKLLISQQMYMTEVVGQSWLAICGNPRQTRKQAGSAWGRWTVESTGGFMCSVLMCDLSSRFFLEGSLDINGIYFADDSQAKPSLQESALL